MGEDDPSLIFIGVWAAFVICVVTYVIYRLLRDPPPANFSETSKIMTRMMGFPKMFDALLARSMTGREKFGWLVVIAAMALAAVFTPQGH
jgi:predicted permease